MRNLKRVLSLALALVMVLGMMVITTSAADFSDADEITYTEAMDVMAGLGVFKGNPDGTVAPTQVLTRKEAAVIVARIILGEKMADSLAPTKQIFDDVPLTAATEWYAAEVEYCNNIGMIVGHDGKFNPDGELTGTAFAKLLLCAMGYDADVQGYVGANWDTNINADAMRNGLNIKGVALTAPLTREGTAQMLFQALESKMVRYTSSFDKATNAPIMAGPYTTTTKFMTKYFSNLVKVDGIVSAIEVYQGTTTIGGTKVSNTDANFKNIGYAAHVWALKGAKEYLRTTTAISDVIVEGTSLGVNTNGASFYDMTDEDEYDFIAELDETYQMFYNGVLAAAKVYDLDSNGEIQYVNGYAKTKLEVKDATAYAAYNAALGKVGTKVDFVDNDNKGMAEAVIVTEYTFAEVTRVLKESKSGEVSVKYYELTTKFGPEKKDWDVELVRPSEMVGATELAKGDYVTYVAYDLDNYAGDLNDYDSYFVNVLDVAEGVYEDYNRYKLYGDNNNYVTIYTIDGEGYIKSELAPYYCTAYLNNSNINKDVVYVLDQYGNVVFVDEPAADPSDYLYVFDNEHSKILTGLAETVVAYTDGSVELVNVKKVVAHSALKNQVFTYAVKNGAHVLGNAEYVTWTGVNYDTYEVTLNGVDATAMTIVDLRDVFAGKAENGTVYTGYTDIPSFLDGTLLYIEEIDLAFLTAGKAPASAIDSSASFVVFNTAANKVDMINVGTAAAPDYEWTYELKAGVLVKGELVEGYILSEDQKAIIDAFGVGAYTFAKDGTLAAYTSFAEDTVLWTPAANGNVIIDGVDVTAAGTFNDIIVLDIAYGDIDYWRQLVQAGEYYSYTDAKNKILYVVGDATVVAGEYDQYWESILAATTYSNGNAKNPTGEINGKQYWAYTGKVTNYALAPVVEAATYTVNEVLKYAVGADVSVEGYGEYIAVKNAATGAVVEYAAVKNGVASFKMPACNVVTEGGYYNYFLNGVEKFVKDPEFQNNTNWACLADLAGTVADNTFVKVEWTDKGVAKSATFDAAALATTPIDVVNYDEYITTNWVSVTGVEEDVFYAQIGDKITYTNPLTDYAVDVTIVGTDIKSARVNVGDSLTLVVEGNVEVTAVPFVQTQQL